MEPPMPCHGFDLRAIELRRTFVRSTEAQQIFGCLMLSAHPKRAKVVPLVQLEIDSM